MVEVGSLRCRFRGRFGEDLRPMLAGTLRGVGRTHRQVVAQGPEAGVQVDVVGRDRRVGHSRGVGRAGPGGLRGLRERARLHRADAVAGGRAACLRPLRGAARQVLVRRARSCMEPQVISEIGRTERLWRSFGTTQKCPNVHARRILRGPNSSQVGPRQIQHRPRIEPMSTSTDSGSTRNRPPIDQTWPPNQPEIEPNRLLTAAP